MYVILDHRTAVIKPNIFIIGMEVGVYSDIKGTFFVMKVRFLKRDLKCGMQVFSKGLFHFTLPCQSWFSVSSPLFADMIHFLLWDTDSKIIYWESVCYIKSIVISRMHVMESRGEFVMSKTLVHFCGCLEWATLEVGSWRVFLAKPCRGNLI